MRFVALIVALLFCVAVFAQTPTTQYSAPAAGKQVAQNAVGFDYWLYLPEGYEEQGDWPLVIFLHGAGARDLGHAITNGTLPGRIAKGDHFPFILASPFFNNKWWTSDELIVFVDAVAARYKVDLRRIYITGLSMGGYGTWELACRYPDRFAAALPICGGGTPSIAPRMKDVPTWAFHGALDRTVPMTESQKMVDALKAAGGNVQFTVLPKAAHVSWPEVYRNPEIYKWLLSHVKASPAEIDRQAELRHAMSREVQCDFLPLLSEQSTVGRLSSRFTVANTLDVPLEISGTLTASGMEVSPGTFQFSVAPGASSELPFEAIGLEVGLDTKPVIEAAWSTTVRQPGKAALTLDTVRRLPISRIETCQRASGPILVDGLVDEWDAAWIDIPSSGRNEELRTTMAVAYTEDAVYAAVRVVDSVVESLPTKGVWEQDGVEVRFDFRPIPRGRESRDWEEILPVLASPAEDAAKPIIWRPEALPEGVQVASRRTAAGYDTEVAVPMSYVRTKLAGRPLEQFRVNLCVNDADGKRQVTKNWWHPDWRRQAGDDGTGCFRIR